MDNPRLFFSFISIARQYPECPWIESDYNRTDVQRNKFGIQLLKSKDYTHVLMLDADEVHPPQTVSRLAQRVRDNPEIEVIAALAYRRGEPYEPMAYRLAGKDQLEAMIEAAYAPGLYECDAMSTGAMMIARSVFERLPYPWFQYDYRAAASLAWPDCALESIDNIGLRSEDLYFCELCRNAGIKLWIDTTVQSAHAARRWVTRDTFVEHMKETPAFQLFKTLCDRAPAVFGAEAQPGKVLYVGARPDRCALGNELARVHKLTLLEVWPVNAAYYQDDSRFERVILGDVRTWQADEHYDTAVWWHGPEHIQRSELAGALAGLEAVADRVILGCPWGEYVQGAYGGNPYEEHVATLQPEDFEALGYEVTTLGTQNDPASNIVAIKNVKR